MRRVFLKFALSVFCCFMGDFVIPVINCDPRGSDDCLLLGCRWSVLQGRFTIWTGAHFTSDEIPTTAGASFLPITAITGGTFLPPKVIMLSQFSSSTLQPPIS